MKKQELIHCHGLLAEVATYCKGEDVPLDLEAYRSLAIRPTSIQLSKTDHTEAVFALTGAITSAIADAPGEVVSASAD